MDDALISQGGCMSQFLVLQQVQWYLMVFCDVPGTAATSAAAVRWARWAAWARWARVRWARASIAAGACLCWAPRTCRRPRPPRTTRRPRTRPPSRRSGSPLIGHHCRTTNRLGLILGSVSFFIDQKHYQLRF